MARMTDSKYILGQTGHYINGVQRSGERSAPPGSGVSTIVDGWYEPGKDRDIEDSLMDESEEHPLQLEQRLYAPNTFNGGAATPPPKYGYYAINTNGGTSTSKRNDPGPDANPTVNAMVNWSFSDNFGYDVDLANGYAIVGDPTATYASKTNCGAAVLYRVSGREYPTGYSCQAILPLGTDNFGLILPEGNTTSDGYIGPSSTHNAGVRVACGYGRAAVTAIGAVSNTHGKSGTVGIYDYSGKCINIIKGKDIELNTGFNRTGHFYEDGGTTDAEAYHAANFDWDIADLHGFGQGLAIGEGIIAVTASLIIQNSGTIADESRGVLFIFDLDGYELSRTVMPFASRDLRSGFGGASLDDPLEVGRGCSRIDINDGKIIIGDPRFTPLDSGTQDSAGAVNFDRWMTGAVFAFDTNGNYLGKLAQGRKDGGTQTFLSGTSAGLDNYIGGSVSVGNGQITIYRSPIRKTNPATDAYGATMYEQWFENFTSDFEYIPDPDFANGEEYGDSVRLNGGDGFWDNSTFDNEGDQGIDQFRPIGRASQPLGYDDILPVPSIFFQFVDAEDYHTTCLLRNGYKILRTVRRNDSGNAKPTFRFIKQDESGAAYFYRDWEIASLDYGHSNGTDLEGFGRKMAVSNGRIIMSGCIASTMADRFVCLFRFPMATHSKSIFESTMR